MDISKRRITSSEMNKAINYNYYYELLQLLLYLN